MGKLTWHPQETPDELESLYRDLLPELRKVARAGGWALGVHGSMRRDLDLMAMPWRDKHILRKTLVRRLSIVCCGIPIQGNWFRHEAACRVAVTFAIGRKAFLDISFMNTAY